MPEKVAANSLLPVAPGVVPPMSGCAVMPVSTSPITMPLRPVVMAQAGSTLMLDTRSWPWESVPGARRYHWPATGPSCEVVIVWPSGYRGSLTGDAWM